MFKIGDTVANMTIIGREEKIVVGKKKRFICQCSYGKIHYVNGGNLKRCKSCGCKSNSNSLNPMFKHGDSHTKLYAILRGMKRRCYEKEYRDYKRYGARGIRVCDEWLGKDGYLNFKKWALENGYQEGLTIDRIEVNGDYEPSNCRWATNKMQSNNKRNNVFIEYNGERHTIAEWSEILNVSRYTLYARRNKGWDAEHILFYNDNTNHVNQYY